MKNTNENYIGQLQQRRIHRLNCIKAAESELTTVYNWIKEATTDEDETAARRLLPEANANYEAAIMQQV